MVTATEKYVVNDDEDFTTSPTNSVWIAQTFTIGTVGTNVNFVITSLDVKMKEEGSGENIYFGIVPVNPDGSPQTPNGVIDFISTGTFDSSDWDNTAWINVTMTEVELKAGKQYALVVRSTSGNDSSWRADGSSPAYAGGQVWTSTDTGASWTGDATTDFMFQINADDPDGTLCTLGDAISKAGAGASSISISPLLVASFIKQSESRLNVLTKKDWITNYSELSTNIKYILNEVVSDMAAVYIANYDDSGYSSGLEYERKIAILKAEIRELIRELKDLELQEFMENV